MTSKTYHAINSGAKLPRKIKKQLFGTKLNKRKLKALLGSVKIIKDENNDHLVDIIPFAFCPKCGCQTIRTIDHYVEYPEIWWEERCLRCDFHVGGQDNSFYWHVLEDINK